MDNLLNRISEIATVYNQANVSENQGVADEKSSDSQPNTQTEQVEAQVPAGEALQAEGVGEGVEQEVNISLSVLKGYEEKAKMLEDVVGYVEKLSDPKIYYQSERDYLVYQIKKDNSHVPIEVIEKALDGVDGMDTLTALRYGILIENPEIEGGLEGVDELLMERYGVDELTADVPRNVKNKMAIDAKAAKAKIASLVEGKSVNRPSIVNEILQSVTEAKTQYNEALAAWKESQVELPTAIKIGDDFEFRFEQSYLDTVKGVLPEYLAGRGLKPTDEGAMDIVNSEVRIAYIADNLERIAEAYAKYRVSKAVEQLKAEYAGMVEQPKDNNAPADSMNDVLNSLKQKAIKAGLISK